MNAFRKELIRIMPGYSWTVHRKKPGDNYLAATGIQSSGFNRLSTVMVIKRDLIEDNCVEYEVASAGYGTSAPWLYVFTDGTLARAFRGLQRHYETKASIYQQHARALEKGRIEDA